MAAPTGPDPQILVDQEVRNQRTKFQRLVERFELFRMKNNSVKVLWSELHQELNLFKASEGRTLNHCMDEFLRVMSEAQKSYDTKFDRQLHYVVNWLKKLEAKGEGLRRTLDIYKAKNTRNLRRQRKMKVLQDRAVAQDNYLMVQARQKLSGAQHEFLVAERDLKRTVVQFETERLQLLQRSLKEFFHSEMMCHAHMLEELTHMYEIVDTLDTEAAIAESLASVGLPDALNSDENLNDSIDGAAQGASGYADEYSEEEEDGPPQQQRQRRTTAQRFARTAMQTGAAQSVARRAQAARSRRPGGASQDSEVDPEAGDDVGAPSSGRAPFGRSVMRNRSGLGGSATGPPLRRSGSADGRPRPSPV